MNALLTGLIVGLTVIAIVSAGILSRAAFVKPRIGALSERAFAAIIIAVFGILYSVVAINTELGRAFFDHETARVLVRILVVAVLAIPGWWTVLYFTGRLK